MKKRLMLALALILCAALLTACGNGNDQRFSVGTAQQNQSAQQNHASSPLDEEDDYVGEEEYWGGVNLPTQAVATATPAPTMRSQYAGATPVVLDPIDKPTPTPVPKLTVAYTVYDAIKLGLSFEGPAGWNKYDSEPDTFTIQNPNQLLDYPATLTVRAQQVSSDYTESELRTIVNGMLDSIAGAGFEDYNPSQTAGRTLLGKNGIYANYDGTLLAGPQVAGRVHAVCVDRVLYTIHISAPKAQWNEYKELVYDHMRDTLTTIK